MNIFEVYNFWYRLVESKNVEQDMRWDNMDNFLSYQCCYSVKAPLYFGCVYQALIYRFSAYKITGNHPLCQGLDNKSSAAQTFLLMHEG